MTTGDYGVTVSAPVCGTGCPGSIPGSRPERRISFGSFLRSGRLRKQISLLSSGIERRKHTAQSGASTVAEVCPVALAIL